MTDKIHPVRYTINLDGEAADLLPVQVIARFSDSPQGTRAAYRLIQKRLDAHRGERYGAVLARYAPIGKVYTVFAVVDIEYRSTAVRTGYDGDGRVFGTADAFDVQHSTCVVEFNHIDRSVSDAECHEKGGHRYARVVQCEACDK